MKGKKVKIVFACHLFSYCFTTSIILFYKSDINIFLDYYFNENLKLHMF